MYVQITEIFITFFTFITLEFFYAFMNCKRNQIKILKVFSKKKKCNIIKKKVTHHKICAFSFLLYVQNVFHKDHI